MMTAVAGGAEQLVGDLAAGQFSIHLPRVAGEGDRGDDGERNESQQETGAEFFPLAARADEADVLE